MSDGDDQWWMRPTDGAVSGPTDEGAPYGGQPGRPLPVGKRFGAAGLAVLLVVGGGVAGAAVEHLALAGSGANTPFAGIAGGNGGSTGSAGGNSNGFPGGWYGGNPDGADGGAVDPGSGSSAPGSTTGPADAAAVARHVDAGIVDINVSLGYQDAQGAGTGMVLTSSGEVLTNNHVIAGADRISATDVGNGRTYTAKVVGYDRGRDVAVLQLVGASGLKTVSLGDSAKVSRGQGVVAVGNAGGTGGTPQYAGGTVTDLNQQITATDRSDGTSEQLTGLIETDADVVPGDSGGPLVDEQGKVIGMDTAASAGFNFQASTGQGYAIPIKQAVRIARQIEAGQSSSTVHIGSTALLGVEVATSSAGQGGYPGSGYGVAGAQIAQVISGGPADNAGLVAGDTITALDGHAIAAAEQLTTLMLSERPGKKVSLDFVDTDGQQHTVTVRLASGPPQ